MKIAIIAAMSKELKLLLPMIKDCGKVSINNYEFYSGTMGSHEVTAVQCGIGKVNAAVATLTLIETFHPDLVINTGVAGGTGNGAGILDVVLASEVAYHDVWCGPGTEWGEAAGCPPTFACAVPNRLAALFPEIKTGLIASGDIFVSKPEEVKHILDTYPAAMAVDMESAAIAQVCYLKCVPFMCLRVISDTPGAADNIAQYNNFWEDAPHTTFRALKGILSNL